MTDIPTGSPLVTSTSTKFSTSRTSSATRSRPKESAHQDDVTEEEDRRDLLVSPIPKAASIELSVVDPSTTRSNKQQQQQQQQQQNRLEVQREVDGNGGPAAILLAVFRNPTVSRTITSLTLRCCSLRDRDFAQLEHTMTQQTMSSIASSSTTQVSSASSSSTCLLPHLCYLDLSYNFLRIFPTFLLRSATSTAANGESSKQPATASSSRVAIQQVTPAIVIATGNLSLSIIPPFAREVTVLGAVHLDHCPELNATAVHNGLKGLVCGEVFVSTQGVTKESLMGCMLGLLALNGTRVGVEHAAPSIAKKWDGFLRDRVLVGPQWRKKWPVASLAPLLRECLAARHHDHSALLDKAQESLVEQQVTFLECLATIRYHCRRELSGTPDVESHPHEERTGASPSFQAPQSICSYTDQSSLMLQVIQQYDAQAQHGSSRQHQQSLIDSSDVGPFYRLTWKDLHKEQYLLGTLRAMVSVGQAVAKQFLSSCTIGAKLIEFMLEEALEGVVVMPQKQRGDEETALPIVRTCTIAELGVHGNHHAPAVLTALEKLLGSCSLWSLDSYQRWLRSLGELVPPVDQLEVTVGTASIVDWCRNRRPELRHDLSSEAVIVLEQRAIELHQEHTRMVQTLTQKQTTQKVAVSVAEDGKRTHRELYRHYQQGTFKDLPSRFARPRTHDGKNDTSADVLDTKRRPLSPTLGCKVQSTLAAPTSEEAELAWSKEIRSEEERVESHAEDGTLFVHRDFLPVRGPSSAVRRLKSVQSSVLASGTPAAHDKPPTGAPDKPRAASAASESSTIQRLSPVRTTANESIRRQSAPLSRTPVVLMIDDGEENRRPQSPSLLSRAPPLPLSTSHDERGLHTTVVHRPKVGANLIRYLQKRNTLHLRTTSTETAIRAAISDDLSALRSNPTERKVPLRPVSTEAMRTSSPLSPPRHHQELHVFWTLEEEDRARTLTPPEAAYSAERVLQVIAERTHPQFRGPGEVYRSFMALCVTGKLHHEIRNDDELQRVVNECLASRGVRMVDDSGHGLGATVLFSSELTGAQSVATRSLGSPVESRPTSTGPRDDDEGIGEEQLQLPNVPQDDEGLYESGAPQQSSSILRPPSRSMLSVRSEHHSLSKVLTAQRQTASFPPRPTTTVTPQPSTSSSTAMHPFTSEAAEVLRRHRVRSAIAASCQQQEDPKQVEAVRVSCSATMRSLRERLKENGKPQPRLGIKPGSAKSRTEDTWLTANHQFLPSVIRDHLAVAKRSASPSVL